MMKGAVNSDLEAELRVTVLGPHGKRKRIRGIIDTGFDGFLSLPPNVIAELELDWNGKSQAILADGSTASFNMYSGITLWNRRRRPILVDEADTTPLIGTALLAGFQLVVAFQRGGVVAVEPIER